MRNSWIKPLGALLCIAVFALVGCSKSTTNTTAASSMAATASKTLMEQLGGMSGVNKLADSFAANLANQPAVTKYLNADAINNVKSGLVNEIAKASGVAPPNPGVDLKQSLMGKGLDPGAMAAFSSSLQSAAAAQKVGDTSTTALMSLIDPIAKGVVGY